MTQQQIVVVVVEIVLQVALNETAAQPPSSLYYPTTYSMCVRYTYIITVYPFLCKAFKNYMLIFIKQDFA